MAENKVYVGGAITIKPRQPEVEVAKIDDLEKDRKAEKEKREKGG